MSEVFIGPKGEVRIKSEPRLSVPFDKPLTFCKGCREEHYGGCMRPDCVYPELQTVSERVTVASEVRQDRIARAVKNRLAMAVPNCQQDWYSAAWQHRTREPA